MNLAGSTGRRDALPRVRAVVVAFGVLLALTGCAGYRLGPTQDLPYRTVAVPVLKNSTLFPGLETIVTSAIRKRFQTDGTLKLETAGQADVIVTGDIRKYQRRPVRSVRNDAGIPREYKVTITAKIEVRDRLTGKLVFPVTEVEGTAETFVGTDLQSADAQVWPLVADDLAQRVVTLVAERW
jgi:hypothetical protein